MFYVYILRSIQWPGRRYVGVTSDLRRRVEEHNAGKCLHTSKFMPWRVETYVAFRDNAKAIAFEKYLKTGAGWAFSLKRF